jgi:hypothetical protein
MRAPEGCRMTDIVLRDIDPILAERVQRLADAHGWDMPQTLMRILERGLHECEVDGAVRLADHEASVLQAAIQALEQVPSDPGFALIGRAVPPKPEPAQPDQSISDAFELK